MEQEQNTLDIQIGQRIRARRAKLGMTRAELSQRMIVNDFNMRRYEDGLDHIPSPLLFEVARVLDCPVMYFFEDAEGRVRG